MSKDQVLSSVTRFGELLRGYRLAAGLTQQEIAERSGLSVRTICFMENGRTIRPYRGSVRSLADALGLTEPQREELSRASRVMADADLMPVPELVNRAVNGTLPQMRVVVPPRMLPAAALRFVGRACELKALTEMTDRTEGACGAPEIVVVGGMAGVGKTALAVRWAHQVADEFGDGHLYVDLRGYDQGQPASASDALDSFLRALGVCGTDVPPRLDDRAGLYRSLIAEHRMLILVDNARDAGQVRPLLPGTAGCVVIVTSRDSLAGLVVRDGARRLDLDLLPMSDAVELLRALIGPRVDDDPRAALTLAGQCCRLPLALRVAAELARRRSTVPLADLVAEFRDDRRRLELLTARCPG